MPRNDQTENVPVAAGRELEDLAQRYGMDFLSSVPDEMLDASLVSDLPVEWARSNCLLPVRIGGETCALGSDPTQVTEQEYLALLLGSELRAVLAPREVVLKSIERCYYSREDSPGEFIQDIGAAGESAPNAWVETGADDLLHVAEKAPVTQLVNLILLEAVKRRASDIHFEPFDRKLRVRYRVDGVLYEQASAPKHMEEALVSRLKVMARMDIAERRLPQDGMARVKVGEREVDIRVSTVPVAEGERVVLRLLDRDSALLPLEALGMPRDRLGAFGTLLTERNGIVVVSGPTGSGKTTTLYAALGQLDASRRNILTIEDPIEYRLPDIGQIQVMPKIGLTFASGLRHILRQDPDIVLVGETRDVETAEIAMRAALTGHLVFTTLHTNDAPGVILRLIDMGVEPYLLASCIKGVLAQRLVRVLCHACRSEGALLARERDLLGAAVAGLKDRKIWRPVGCAACLEGYTGRTGLFELLVIDDELRGMIRNGRFAAEDLRACAVRNGMVSLESDGLNKVAAGVTSVSEIVNASTVA